MSRAHNLELFVDRILRRSILTDDEQLAILGLPASAQQVEANRDFVRLGERVEYSCLVVAGMVGRFDQDRAGARQITAIYLPGDMCDLHSVVQPVATSALQALSTATIIRVPHDAIRAAAAKHPAIAEAFWRESVADAAILSEWVLNVGRRDAMKRLAHLYCEMAVRLDAVEPGCDEVMFDFPVTQSHLADATALTPVHVNRTLQALRAQGLLQGGRGVVRLPRWGEIVRVAEFCSKYLQRDIRPQQRVRLLQAC